MLDARVHRVGQAFARGGAGMGLDFGKQVGDVDLAGELIAEERDIRPDDRSEIEQNRRGPHGEC